MGLFGSWGSKGGGGDSKTMATGPAMDPKWVRSAAGRFHRFVRLDPQAEGLSRVSGVFVLWYVGARSEWVYVGRSNDLASTFDNLAEDDEVMDYEGRGGLFVTWAMIRGEYQNGVVRHLTDALKPLVDNPESQGNRAEPIPVIAPGAKPTA